MRSSFERLQDPREAAALAARTFAAMTEIYPLRRSITGDGVRQTFDALAQYLPLERVEVPSGTAAYDWEVPREWNVRSAYIADPDGRRIVDVQSHPLHLVGYSVPVRQTMTLDELQPHLHSIPERPDWIPYRTSYWREAWGFCLTHRQREAMKPGAYEVVIDSDLSPGSLTYAECRIPGELDDEFLLFTHSCHPALANDNASGLALTALLGGRLLEGPRPRLTYRIVFAPATIGSIVWLARNADAARRLRAGLVLGLLGDPGPLTYKRSRRGNAEIDYVAARAVRAIDAQARVHDFSPYGYDERQFCSPGFDLPIGRLTRSPNGEYPEYHTSADNLALMRPQALAESIQAICRILARIDSNRRLVRHDAHCEPRLGRHGLFRSTGGKAPAEFEYALLWLLNQADGSHGAFDVADASGLPDEVVSAASDALLAAGLLVDFDAARTNPAPASPMGRITP